MTTRQQRSRTRGRRVLASDRALDDDSDIIEMLSSATRRRRQRGGTNEPIDVDTVADRTCIDLTSDLDNSQNDEVVDLTSVTNTNRNNPIMIMSSAETSRQRPIQLDDTADDETPVFDLSASEDRTSATSSTPAAPTLDDSMNITPGRGITCPVCFDGARRIRTSGRRLMSTTCGHLFCSECITGAIHAQRRCPTCRKTLSVKQVHPIFL